MDFYSKSEKIKEQLQHWPSLLKKYKQPSSKKAIWQIINTLGPFLGLWTLMYFSLDWSYWITLGLAFINGLLLVRVFIIQHDCGHQSFLKSRKWNNVIGFVLSFVSTIPYKFWALNHNFHHNHNGQLEHTSIGDIKTLTVEEYKQLSSFRKLRYRMFRNPIIMFGVGPIYYLLLSCRFPVIPFKGWKKLTNNLTMNNILIFQVYIFLAYLLGWKEFLMIQLPILLVFGVVALWFFYVQHQQEETYKEWQGQWDYVLSAILGSSYYKLPTVLNWFTGSIGYHHIHHLNPSIPNYNLAKCAEENPILQKYVTTISLKESVHCLKLSLWDEKNEKMISFWEYRRKHK